MVKQHIAGAVDLGRQIVRAAVVGVQLDHQPASGGDMTVEEAYAILGLSPGAAPAGELVAPIRPHAIEIRL